MRDTFFIGQLLEKGRAEKAFKLDLMEKIYCVRTLYNGNNWTIKKKADEIQIFTYVCTVWIEKLLLREAVATGNETENECSEDSLFVKIERLHLD